jgi:hypothetical protein
MYTYQPPKSSVWGHALRKMSPLQMRTRFQVFLDAVVGECCPIGGSVFYQPTMESLFQAEPGNRCMAHFARLLKLEEESPAFVNLDPRQVEQCVDELVRDELLYVPGGAGAVVMGGFRVTKWKLGDRLSATDSLFNLYYGANPRISTFLVFRDQDEFSLVRQALEDAGVCRLNEKHLKEKRGRKETPL